MEIVSPEDMGNSLSADNNLVEQQRSIHTEVKESSLKKGLNDIFFTDILPERTKFHTIYIQIGVYIFFSYLSSKHRLWVHISNIHKIGDSVVNPQSTIYVMSKT